MEPVAVQQLAAALAIALGGFAPAIAIGMMGSSAMNAIGRNPESAPLIQTNMILAIVFAEAIAVYALVVALLLKFIPV